MGAMLLIVATMMGGYGLAYAIPQVDVASCEQTALEIRMMTNLPLENVEHECITKEEFLKRVGEREA